jgi:glutamate synthase (NADPH/NADH) small chain
MNTSQVEQPSFHMPRNLNGTRQGLMPGRYGLAVQLLSMAAFTLAFGGWLNETWLFLFENPIWLNRYSEYAIILGFGLWRIIAEQNSYTRKRLIILVGMVTVFWWLLPWLYPVYEPYVGFLWSQPVFPSLHVPGTVTFFLILALVFLFGRRIICGFNCPCVGIRETVGFPFRDRTVRSKWAWRLRHSKWFFFIYYVGVMVVTQYPPNSWTVSFVGIFYLIIAVTYFGTFFIAPLVGNRFYCRYLCPYGATFGLLNHAGFYGINMAQDKCNDCRRCEQVCDMGIPVWQQGKESGRVTGIEDCMGCARCVVSCPTDALEIRDVRNLFRPKMVQNASHLLKRNVVDLSQRQEPAGRPVEERLNDWQETSAMPELARIQEQAARCLDCGRPGCINACPLSNRIPEWLEAVAAGEIGQAATIAHSTSNLPEVCGRLCPQHRLCEGACTKAKEAGGAVTIGAAERFLTDEAFKRGWRPTVPTKRISRHVAVIGAGPAGIACADQLRQAGCDVTVYDKHRQFGGLLATGVPPFKLDKSILVRRQEYLQETGIQFQLGVEVDEPLMERLLTDHDAVFLGTGAQSPKILELPGQGLAGVSDALSYLAAVNKAGGGDEMAGKRVLVLGGGDSAMDSARAAIRQGALRVGIAYRGNEAAMRASPKEQQAARAEGAVFLFERVPETIIGKDIVTGIRFKSSDRNKNETIDCDAVIFALGQIASPPAWLTRLGIATDDRGVIHIDGLGRTSHAKVYAGGDNTHGSDLVVTAIAAGRKAAEAILNDLSLSQRVFNSAVSLLHGSAASTSATAKQAEATL